MVCNLWRQILGGVLFKIEAIQLEKRLVGVLTKMLSGRERTDAREHRALLAWEKRQIALNRAFQLGGNLYNPPLDLPRHLL